MMGENKTVSFHRMLINDAVRTGAYRDAIFATVRPGDVVLDIGSGSGVLALFAAQAGAGHVHCVEREAIIRIARELAEANGFADRISFHQCDIRELQLDGPVDLIQSELIGKAAIGEQMAELVGWCRDRFLRPGGVILPPRVDLFVAPVELIALAARTSLPPFDVYGLDFAPLAARNANAPVSTRVEPGDVIAPGQVAYHYDAATAPLTDCFDAALSFDVEDVRTLNGFTIWFEAELAPGITLGNAPPGTGSWDHSFFPMPRPVALAPGDRIDLRVAARDDSAMEWLWRWDTRVLRGGCEIATYRQSTLQGALPVPERIPAPA
jgi:protein arginine N-methyltransferase 1